MGGDFNKPPSDFNKPPEQVNYSPPPPPVQQLNEPVQDNSGPILSFNDFFERFMEASFPNADAEQERQMRRSMIMILGTLFLGGLYFILSLIYY
jgi:hypothetical protein